MIAIHDCGASGTRRNSIAPKRTTIASSVRWILKLTGSARCRANFIASQFIPQITVSTASAM